MATDAAWEVRFDLRVDEGVRASRQFMAPLYRWLTIIGLAALALGLALVFIAPEIGSGVLVAAAISLVLTRLPALDRLLYARTARSIVGGQLELAGREDGLHVTAPCGVGSSRGRA